MVLKQGKIPEAWKKGVVIPLYKKGPMDDPNNYRGITLLSLVGKLLEKILKERLDPVLGEKIATVQGGGRKGKGCLEQAWGLRALLDNRRRRRKGTVLAFLDVRKAYDSVWQDKMWERVLKTGIDPGLVGLLKEWYRGQRSRVRFNGCLSRWFMVERGVRQGGVLSPILYCVFIDSIVHRVRKGMRGIQIGDVQVCVLLFMDDIVLIGESVLDVQQGLDVCWECALACKFQFNADKCEWMVCGQVKDKDTVVYMGMEMLHKTQHFKYLGIWFSANGRWKRMADHSIGNAKGSTGRTARYGMHKGQCGWVGRAIAEADCLSRLFYGTEVWTPPSTTLKAMDSVMASVGRRALGAPQFAPTCLVLKEMGWKSSVCRVLKRRLKLAHKLSSDKQYLGQIWRAECEEWVRGKRCKWWVDTEEMWQSMGGSPHGWLDLLRKGGNAVDRKLNALDFQRWKRLREEMGSRGQIHKAVCNYDEAAWYLEWGGTGAAVVAESRLGCLPVNIEGRRRGISTGACSCGEGEETIEHFWMSCKSLDHVRKQCMEGLGKIGANLSWLLAGGNRTPEHMRKIVIMGERLWKARRIVGKVT
jgi:hypothetical protein